MSKILNFSQIRKLGLHDAQVKSWKLDLERKSLVIGIDTAFACSIEYGEEGLLSLENFSTVSLTKWNDSQKGIPENNLIGRQLKEILHEEYTESSYEISAYGEQDWEVWRFEWDGFPQVTYEIRKRK